jgi:hypothetical protein
MNQSNGAPKKSNVVRARVTIRGTRPLLQHAFGPDAIPLEKQEKEGVGGNDPSEWRRTCMLTPEGQLYLKGENVFACLRDGAKYTKKGRGSIQPLLAATLLVEEAIVPLNRRLPPGEEPRRDPTKRAEVFLDVSGVRNPSTKGRNIRYRLAAGPGWECTFTITFDRTIVSREQMRAVLRDASVLVGIGDGRSVGNGRFEVLAYEELTGAEEEAAAGGMGELAPDRVGKGRKGVRPLPAAAGADGMPH